MTLDSVLDFGKYSGRTIEDIWVGKITENVDEVLRLYVQELCDLVINSELADDNFPKGCLDVKVFENELLFFEQSSTYKKAEVIGNKVTVSADDPKTRYVLYVILELLLQDSLLVQTISRASWIQEFYSDNSKKFVFLQGNPNYIDWCILNVDRFAINPGDLDSLIKIRGRRLSHFNVHVWKHIFTFLPVYKTFRYKMPDKTIAFNENKFLSKNKRRESTFSHDDLEDENFCYSCQQSPCMCSDREQSSSIYDW